MRYMFLEACYGYTDLIEEIYTKIFLVSNTLMLSAKAEPRATAKTKKYCHL